MSEVATCTEQSGRGRVYKSTSAARISVRRGLAVSHAGPPCQGMTPLCNLFDSAHVIVQVWGCSGPRGACHIPAAPTQVLFVFLIFFTGGH